MITRHQQILIKRAQREASLDDADYREALETVSGLRSTKAPGMTDRHVDLFLAYVEAIFWRKVDAGALQPSGKADAVFRQRRYWAAKNPGQQTSRDRYTQSTLESGIARLEAALAELGFGQSYCEAICQNATGGVTDPSARYLYKVALERTLRSTQKARERANDPF